MKLIIFDCDGTLVDGQYLILDAMQTACRSCDVFYPGDEAIREIVGLSLMEAIEIRYSEEDQKTRLALKDAFVSRFQQLRQSNQDNEPLFDGVRETIEHLAEDGYLLGIATGKSRHGLDITLKNHQLSDFFLTLNTADDGPGKPHPAMVLNAMDAVGARPEDTLMVGDTSYDIDMARAAKVHAVGVSWGYHDSNRLRQAGAHHIIDHMSQLRQIADETFL